MSVQTSSRRGMRLRLMPCLFAACAFALASACGSGTVGDRERLQGTWHVESAVLEGSPWATPALLKQIDVRWEFKGDRVATLGNFQGFGERGQVPEPFRIDETAKPKAIDIMRKDDKNPWRGIYELSNNRLRVCGVPNATPDLRPRAFRSTQKGGEQLYEFSR